MNTHQAFVLLKNPFAIPKLTYLLRSSWAFQEVDLLKEFDNTLIDDMSTITNIDFTNDSWTQAT